MATKDEILNPPKGTKDWAEANSGENAVAPQAQTTVPAAIPTVRSFDSNSGYDGLLSALPKPPKSQQELDDEMRRHRRSQIFNAIGDGLSALSNLYFTTKGAPNMYDGRNSAMRREDNRYRRMLEDNKSDYREYNNAVRVHDELADREWRRNRQSYMDEYDRKLKEAEHERDSQLFELQLRLQNHKISAADAEARRKQIEADYADELNLAKIDTERARARSYKASAGASNSRARYYDNGGGGNKPGEYPWYDRDGKKHFAHSYEAMRQNAIDAGTWNEATETSIRTESRGRKTSTSKTTKPGKGYSSPKDDDNIPPSRRVDKQEDNTPPSRRK